MQIKTSIVIATYNGSVRLVPLLKSLLSILNDNREIVIIDDGSTDDTIEIIKSLTHNNDGIRFYRISNSGKSIARNTGARIARGELIVFIDDDIEIHSDFLIRHESIKERHPESWVTGTVRQKIEEIPHADFLRFRCKLDYDRSHLLIDSNELIEVDSFSTAQLCVRADLFHEFGGFDEGLRDCEDFELSVRVRDAGYSILHDTKNVVFHRDFSTFDRFIKRQLEYSEGRKQLLSKRPELAARFPQIFGTVDAMSVSMRFIRKFFVYGPTWAWFFQSSFRYILPEKCLHLAYDWVSSSTFLLSLQESTKSETI